MSVEPKRTSRLAVASFFLSLATLFAGPFGFVPGIICGHLARRQVARNPHLDDPGFAKGGLVLGYTFLVLSAIVVVAVSAYVLGAFATMPPGQSQQVLFAQETLELIGDSLERYHDRTGAYPTTTQGLRALNQKPTIEPIPERWVYSLAPQYLTDPWGNPYQYRYPGIRNPKGYDLWCLGPDGEAGTDDDMIAW